MTETRKLNQPTPRRVEEIERQLADVAKLKHEAESHGTSECASETALGSLRRHEQELLEELRVAKQQDASSAELPPDQQAQEVQAEESAR